MNIQEFTSGLLSKQDAVSLRYKNLATYKRESFLVILNLSSMIDQIQKTF